MKAIRFPGGLRKVGSAEPTYWLEIAVETDDGDELTRFWLGTTADKLLSWPASKRAIFELTDVVPELEIPKKGTATEVWEGLISQLAETIEYVDAPPEASEAGAMVAATCHAILRFALCSEAKQFELGMRRYETEGNASVPPFVVVRWPDLMAALDNQGQKPKRQKLWQAIEQVGFQNRFAKIGEKSFRVLAIEKARLQHWRDENLDGLEPEVTENGLSHTKVTSQIRDSEIKVTESRSHGGLPF